MLTYGICAGPSDKAERLTVPSIRVCDPGAEVIVVRGFSSIFSAYNEILQRAAALPDVSGLVLLHDDVELLAPFSQEVHDLASDPTVGIIGAIGGKEFPKMVWWDGERRGRVEDNQYGLLEYSSGTHDVDAVDGLLIILTTAGLKSLKFDARTYGNSFHGYDSDIAAQARSAGLRVVVTDMVLKHHNNVRKKYGDIDMLKVSSARYCLKWKGLPLRERLLLRLRIVRRLASRRVWILRTGSPRIS